MPIYSIWIKSISLSISMHDKLVIFTKPILTTLIYVCTGEYFQKVLFEIYLFTYWEYISENRRVDIAFSLNFTILYVIGVRIVRDFLGKHEKYRTLEDNLRKETPTNQVYLMIQKLFLQAREHKQKCLQCKHCPATKYMSVTLLVVITMSKTYSLHKI